MMADPTESLTHARELEVVETLKRCRSQLHRRRRENVARYVDMAIQLLKQEIDQESRTKAEP